MYFMNSQNLESTPVVAEVESMEKMIGVVRKVDADAASTASRKSGHKALYGLANLPKHHAREDIEAACATLLEIDSASYRTLARLVERKTLAREAAAQAPALTQSAPEIRAIDDYQHFFDQHAHTGDDRCP